MQGTALAQPGDLPRLVGYKHLLVEYGWPKRTLQEWIKNRKFPKPLELPGRENFWYLHDVLEWLENRRQGLCAVAITRPDDLEPEFLAEAAVVLLAKAIEHELGEPIDPRGIAVSYGPPSEPVTEEALATAEARAAQILQSRFYGYSIARSVIMAAWLFPGLRQMFADGAIVGCGDVFLDEQALFALAVKAMNEHAWEDGLAELKALAKRGDGIATTGRSASD